MSMLFPKGVGSNLFKFQRSRINTSVTFVVIIFLFFEKNGGTNAVLSAIFYVLHPAKLRQMTSSTILSQLFMY